ncbi:unnamed protein product [Leuciscus chuanchicus]
MREDWGEFWSSVARGMLALQIPTALSPEFTCDCCGHAYISANNLYIKWGVGGHNEASFYRLIVSFCNPLNTWPQRVLATTTNHSYYARYSSVKVFEHGVSEPFQGWKIAPIAIGTLYVHVPNSSQSAK